MARPKVTNEQDQARQKIIDVFWQLLEKEPYSKISVREIAGRAGVNHNTFYYHFKNIDDMAIQLVKETVSIDIFQMLMTSKSTVEVALAAVKLPPDIRRRHYKMYLLLKNGDARIADQLKREALSLWLQQTARTRESLKSDEEFALNFIFGGIITAVAETEFEMNATTAKRLMKVPVVQASIQTIKDLSNGKHYWR